MIELLREKDEDEETPDDLPAMRLLNRKSVELWFLERAFPYVPLFPGATTEWPDWYFRDRRIIARVDGALRREKAQEEKARQWAEKAQKELKRG